MTGAMTSTTTDGVIALIATMTTGLMTTGLMTTGARRTHDDITGTTITTTDGVDRTTVIATATSAPIGVARGGDAAGRTTVGDQLSATTGFMWNVGLSHVGLSKKKPRTLIPRRRS